MSRMSSLSFFPMGGVGGNSQTVISWRKRKRGRQGKEAGNSQSLSPFAPLVWEQAAVLLPFWTELCRSPLVGRQKNGESKSKQSHLFKWATTSQWQRGVPHSLLPILLSCLCWFSLNPGKNKDYFCFGSEGWNWLMCLECPAPTHALWLFRAL